MEQYKVTGMSCAACVARVEQAVRKVKGVEHCSVSLLTNSMGVEGPADSQAIIEAVEKAGYRVTLKKRPGEIRTGNSGNIQETDYADELKDRESPALKKRLLWSLVFLIVLMYFSMGHMAWGFKIPALFEENAVALGILEMLLASIVLVINQKFFVSGVMAVRHLSPNMDTLVALGAGVSFGYSVVRLILMTSVQLHNGIAAAGPYSYALYFESAAMILTLITIGKYLEAKAKGKTTNALKGLMKLVPKEATILVDGREQRVPVDKVSVGDLFVVKPGENIPVDGMVEEGSSAINESALSGESIPVDKVPGDTVSAATINQSGYIKCRAVRIGQDTTLSQIIHMVSDAAATKAKIAKVADKVAGVFVPVVLGIAFCTFVIWLICGESVAGALSYGISVLVISCPCSLGLATPVALMVGNGVGAKHGILYKNADALETAGRITVAALDKTGTITTGNPEVTDIYPGKGVTERSLLSVAYALEAKSEHPLAKAIGKKAEEKGILLREVQDFQAMPGRGLCGKLDGIAYYAGNKSYIERESALDEDLKTLALKVSKEGKTPLFFADGERTLGIIAVADTVKTDAKQAIEELKQMGIKTVMLSGDNERTAKAIADQVGIEEIIAEVLPDGKEEVIRNLQKTGKVAMVGDGINDAPALTRADLGIAIGSGTDIAIEAADIVLVKSRLRDVGAALKLGRVTLKTIKQNLFWAFCYNSIGIPVAAGAFAFWGIKLPPMFGAAAMSLSSFCVVSNALRINLVKLLDEKQSKKEKTKTMTKTIVIEGMMCMHCEAHVKSALEGISGVTEAKVSHEAGTAVVTYEGEITDDTFRNAIEAEKYVVVSMK